MPRPFVPGATYLLTRRCSERRFFLRPSKKIRQICEFCLARAAKKTGVVVHAYKYLSNHFHMVVTDPDGRLPEFMHWHNEYIAKCVNAELRRTESFWAGGSYSSVRLADHAALVGGLIYTFNNAVSSGLVSRAADWPGARNCPKDWEREPRVVKRPKVFFREDGPVPESVQLEVSPPSGLECSIEELERLVAEDEQRLRDELESSGKKFLGKRGVLKASPFDSPDTVEERGKLNPRVAAKGKERRIEALRQLKDFVSAYRDALAKYLAGKHDVLFPHGTYWMRVHFAVRCLGP